MSLGLAVRSVQSFTLCRLTDIKYLSINLIHCLYSKYSMSHTRQGRLTRNSSRSTIGHHISPASPRPSPYPSSSRSNNFVVRNDDLRQLGVDDYNASIIVATVSTIVQMGYADHVRRKGSAVFALRLGVSKRSRAAGRSSLHRVAEPNNISVLYADNELSHETGVNEAFDGLSWVDDASTKSLPNNVPRRMVSLSRMSSLSRN